jgi:hypothetical protein
MSFAQPEARIAQRSNGHATPPDRGPPAAASRPPPLPPRAQVTARMSAQMHEASPVSRAPASAAIVRGSSPGLAGGGRQTFPSVTKTPMPAPEASVFHPPAVTMAPYERAFQQWSTPSLGIESEATAPVGEPATFHIVASHDWHRLERRARASRPPPPADGTSWLKGAALAVLGGSLLSFVVAAQAFAAQDEPSLPSSRASLARDPRPELAPSPVGMAGVTGGPQAEPRDDAAHESVRRGTSRPTSAAMRPSPRAPLALPANPYGG